MCYFLPFLQQSAFIRLLVVLISLTLALSKPTAKHPVGFAADTSINVKAISSAIKSSRANVLASFGSGQGGPPVKIFAKNIGGEPITFYTADMDVDCDGIDFRCPHNPDGQPQTSFGHLDASKVPFYVVPDSFFQSHSSTLKPNALGAVICNNKMFYGILGDTDGDNPEVIGEASILMAQTCFPSDGLDGGTGHSPLDVLYIIFGQSVPSGVGDKTIDIAALKRLGDSQVKKLAKALGV